MTTNKQNPGTQLAKTQRGRLAIYQRPAAKKAHVPQPQSPDLEAWARGQGYTDITVFAERYIPGTVPLARRDAFNALKAAIVEPQSEQAPVQAIVVASADRLFRSTSMMEDIALFIDLCASRGITVMTPTASYDFGNHSDVVRFCFACMTAGESLEAVVTSRLQMGKRAAAARRRGQATNQ